jgi:3-phosphoshikimate 1-carboxyvinyltransferase
MGMKILSRAGNLAPLVLQGSPNLRGIDYRSNVSSSEVKTTIILAALKAKTGETTIRSQFPSRDHSERLLEAMGHPVKTQDEGRIVTIRPLERALKPLTYTVPGEMSAAVYWIVLGLVHPDCDITVKSVCVNPSRMGLINVLKSMGGNIEIKEIKGAEFIEPVADVRVRTSQLRGVTISPEFYPQMADEFVGFALAASFAQGETIITGAEDLRNKKSNRIANIVEEFRKLGADVEETKDGMIFRGVKERNKLH